MKYFIHLPMKMEPTVSSETSAIRTQTLGNYPKRNKLRILHTLLKRVMRFEKMSISYHNSREVYEEEMGCSSTNRITSHKGISYLKGARQTCCQSIHTQIHRR